MTEKILDKIIRSEYRSQLQDWPNYIKPTEQLGLEIIEQIYRSKGNKPVHVLLPEQKIMYETHHSLMNRKHQTSYHHPQVDYKKPKKNIDAISSPPPISIITATPSPNPSATTSSTTKHYKK